jgi:Zn-dependent protease with chaperone function
MDATAFEALVTRTEALAARRPRAYRWWVFALAMVGYLYLAMLVAVLPILSLLALASMLFLKAAAIKLLVLAGAPLLLALSSLRVKASGPSGLRLTRQGAPQLFQVLDELRRRLNAQRLHAVLLTGDFNAGISQVPRLGLFGWHRNYLSLGLPMMKALSVEQFRSVIGHELGHLARGHARAGHWIYRLRVIWQRLSRAFEGRRHWGALLVQPFFARYIPYFVATSFPLARANEYEADATSVELTCARVAAQALTGFGVTASYLDEHYWPAIQARAQHMPQPAVTPIGDFTADAVRQVPPQDLKRWQEAALATTTSLDDTHPCLTDRLKAMGAPAELALPAPGESADTLLEPERARLQSALDEVWRKAVEQPWTQAYQRAQSARQRLAQLRTQAGQSELEESAALTLARLEEENGAGAGAALALRRALVAKNPDSLPARFHLAGQLLRSGDAEGVGLMASVIEQDVNALVSGAQLLRDYYARLNEMEQAVLWHRRCTEREELLAAAREERDQWLVGDVLDGHQLPPEVLARLLEQLSRIPGLTAVYFARKLTRYFPEEPLYVMGYRVGRWWTLATSRKAQAVMARIKQEMSFPGETLILNIEGGSAGHRRSLRGIQGSRIL